MLLDVYEYASSPAAKLAGVAVENERLIRISVFEAICLSFFGYNYSYIYENVPPSIFA